MGAPVMIEGVRADQVRYHQDVDCTLWATVADRPYSVICLAVTVQDPLPEEFLLRQVTLGGFLPTRWSLFRAAESRWGNDLLALEICTADRFTYRQLISRDLADDPAAWRTFQHHTASDYLHACQEARTPGSTV